MNTERNFVAYCIVKDFNERMIPHCKPRNISIELSVAIEMGKRTRTYQYVNAVLIIGNGNEINNDPDHHRHNITFRYKQISPAVVEYMIPLQMPDMFEGYADADAKVGVRLYKAEDIIRSFADRSPIWTRAIFGVSAI